jgi:hypothetical protein
LHQRHVAQPGEGQMERARYRSGGERKYVGIEVSFLVVPCVFRLPMFSSTTMSPGGQATSGL